MQSGNGNRDDGDNGTSRRLGNSFACGSARAHRRHASDVVVDEGAWARAGEELRRRDPQRYIAILKVVEDICSIYRDPLGDNLAEGHYVFTQGDPDHFD